MNRKNLTIGLLVVILAWSATAAAVVWHVEADGTGDAPTIAAALDPATEGRVKSFGG